MTFAETAWYSDFGSAHNIVINEDIGYAYAVGTTTCGQGLHFVDISKLLMVAAHDWDIAGAAAAGCRTAFVTRPGVFWSLPGEPPGLVVDDLAGLVGALTDG